jgi:hypothetical protein
MRTILTLVFFLFLMQYSIAQEDSLVKKTPLVRAAIMMGNSHTPNNADPNTTAVVAPTWGLDIDYLFHKKLAVAFQADIKLQNIIVQDEATTLRRENPLTIATVLHYNIIKAWSVYAGPGYEFETHKNLYLVKIGTEYSFEVNENFEIAVNLIYENKESIYDTWTFGVAFNKVLLHKKKN